MLNIILDKDESKITEANEKFIYLSIIVTKCQQETTEKDKTLDSDSSAQN